MHKAKRIRFKCRICGADFYRLKSQLKKPRHEHPKFCSVLCASKRKRLNKTKSCQRCGKILYVAPWEEKAGRKYCSRFCRSLHWDRDRLREFLLDIRVIKGKCWLYPYSVTSRGYANIRVDERVIGIHKVSAWVFLGSETAIVRGRSVNVCHTCDVRHCFNPKHLVVATPKFNSEDMVNKRRHASNKKTHCKYGHPFSGDNLVWVKSYTGKQVRGCRTCINDRSREHTAGIHRIKK